MNQEIFVLRRDASELSKVLYEGTVWRHGEPWIALPREVVGSPARTDFHTRAQTGPGLSRSKQGFSKRSTVLASMGHYEIDSVVFEIVRPGTRSHPRLFKDWVSALRLGTLAMTFVPALTILVLGLQQGLRPAWTMVILSYLGVLCLHMGIHFLNEVNDHVNLVTLPGKHSGQGVLQKGWLSAKQLQGLGIGVLVFGFFAGLPAIVRSPVSMILVVLMGAFGVAGYVNRPMALRRGRLGDFLIWLLFGPLLCVGFSLAFFETLSAGAVVVGIVYGFWAWTVHHCEHLTQLGSKYVHQSTLASWLGYRSSRLALGFGYGLAFLCLLVGGLLGWLPMLGVLISFLSASGVVVLLRRVYRASGPSSALLSPIVRQASRLYFGLGLSLAVGIGLSTLFFI